MSLRHVIGPTLGRALDVVRKGIGLEPPPFVTAILHDVPESSIDSLVDFLDFVASRHGFISPDQAEKILANGEEGPPLSGGVPCLITVDDGFASSRKIGCEILTRYGARGIFFVCPGIIDLPRDQQTRCIRQNVFDGHPPDPMPELMSWQAVEDLRRCGHTLGAHGLFHNRLATLSGERLECEIVGSRERLAARLGEAPGWYAYAFGDIDSISADALRLIRNNFRICRSGIRGTVARQAKSIMFAQEIDLKTPLAYQQCVLNGTLDLFHTSARRRLDDYWRTASQVAN